MKILHVADLHLSNDVEAHGAGLDVLAEVLRLTRAFDVDALLFTGHLLDDVGALDPATLELLQAVPAPVLCVCAVGEPTQHLAEKLHPARVLTAAPFELVELGEGDSAVELVCLAPRPSHADFHAWPVPEKGTRRRILAAHADLLGLPSADAQDGPRPVLDPDLLERLAVDHVALGGAHTAPAPTTVRGASVHVAGSARITDAREPTQRQAVLITVAETITTEPLPLPSAGRFVRMDLWIGFDGALPEELQEASLGANDHLEVRLRGAVASIQSAQSAASVLRQRLHGAVRRLDVNTDAISHLTDPAAESLARRFDSLWRDHRDEKAADRWDRARQLALETLQRKAG